MFLPPMTISSFYIDFIFLLNLNLHNFIRFYYKGEITSFSLVIQPECENRFFR